MRYRDCFGRYHEKPSDAKVETREAAYGLLERDGKILCVKENWCKRWGLPGGGIEDGETPRQALEREFLEETGFRVEAEEEFLQEWDQKFYNHLSKRFYEGHNYIYRIKKILEKDEEAMHEEEVLDLEWKDFSELDESNTVVIHLDALRETFEK